MRSNRNVIYDEINNERDYQLTRFGTKFDATNSTNDWLAYITAYAGKCYSSNRKFYSWNFRGNMIKVAALAVAAIEAYDIAQEKQTKA